MIGGAARAAAPAPRTAAAAPAAPAQPGAPRHGFPRAPASASTTTLAAPQPSAATQAAIAKAARSGLFFGGGGGDDPEDLLTMEDPVDDPPRPLHQPSSLGHILPTFSVIGMDGGPGGDAGAAQANDLLVCSSFGSIVVGGGARN